MDIEKVSNHSNNDSYSIEQKIDNKAPSIAGRIVKYVFPGAIIGAGLGIITGGMTSLIFFVCSFKGRPQDIRDSFQRGIIKQIWSKLDADTKIQAVALIAIMAVIAASILFALYSLPLYFSIPGIVGLGLAGATCGILFSSGLSDPPLIDLP